MRRSADDGAFRALLGECQRVLGHTLSSADLNTLFGIYDRLGMTAETILLLIHHCADKLRRRYGEGRLPTMRAIEKEAFYWANREILTAPQAEEYLAALARRDEEMEKVRHALSLTGRDLTPTERKYIESWLSMGYGAEALAIAYDRTVVGTGKLAWAYMDKIVKSWYEKKLFTAEQIEKGDMTPYEQVLAELNARDAQDMNRETDPLRQAEDAVLVDSTNMTPEQVVDAIIAVVEDVYGKRA